MDTIFDGVDGDIDRQVPLWSMALLHRFGSRMRHIKKGIRGKGEDIDLVFVLSCVLGQVSLLRQISFSVVVK